MSSDLLDPTPIDHEEGNQWCACRNCCCKNQMCTHQDGDDDFRHEDYDEQE